MNTWDVISLASLCLTYIPGFTGVGSKVFCYSLNVSIYIYIIGITCARRRCSLAKPYFRRTSHIIVFHFAQNSGFHSGFPKKTTNRDFPKRDTPIYYLSCKFTAPTSQRVRHFWRFSAPSEPRVNRAKLDGSSGVEDVVPGCPVGPAFFFSSPNS